MPMEVMKMAELKRNNEMSNVSRTSRRVLYWIGAVILIVSPLILGGLSGLLSTTEIYSGNVSLTYQSEELQLFSRRQRLY